MREYHVRFCERLGLKCPCLLDLVVAQDLNALPGRPRCGRPGFKRIARPTLVVALDLKVLSGRPFWSP